MCLCTHCMHNIVNQLIVHCRQLHSLMTVLASCRQAKHVCFPRFFHLSPFHAKVFYYFLVHSIPGCSGCISVGGKVCNQLPACILTLQVSFFFLLCNGSCPVFSKREICKLFMSLQNHNFSKRATIFFLYVLECSLASLDFILYY